MLGVRIRHTLVRISALDSGFRVSRCCYRIVQLGTKLMEQMVRCSVVETEAKVVGLLMKRVAGAKTQQAQVESQTQKNEAETKKEGGKKETQDTMAQRQRLRRRDSRDYPESNSSWKLEVVGLQAGRGIKKMERSWWPLLQGPIADYGGRGMPGTGGGAARQAPGGQGALFCSPSTTKRASAGGAAGTGTSPSARARRMQGKRALFAPIK